MTKMMHLLKSASISERAGHGASLFSPLKLHVTPRGPIPVALAALFPLLFAASIFLAQWKVACSFSF
jgi:hypothetical protein